MDRNGDGKVTIYDLEELAVRNLASAEKRLSSNKMIEDRLKVAKRPLIIRKPVTRVSRPVAK